MSPVQCSHMMLLFTRWKKKKSTENAIVGLETWIQTHHTTKSRYERALISSRITSGRPKKSFYYYFKEKIMLLYLAVHVNFNGYYTRCYNPRFFVAMFAQMMYNTVHCPRKCIQLCTIYINSECKHINVVF